MSNGVVAGSAGLGNANLQGFCHEQEPIKFWVC